MKEGNGGGKGHTGRPGKRKDMKEGYEGRV
jgi:hypothetical protein